MPPLAAPRIEPARQDRDADPLSRLALLHAEAEETARLANLVGRSLPFTLVLPLFGLFTIMLSPGVPLISQMAWGVFIAFGVVAVLRTYATAIAAPFERTLLKSFAKDMSAILLYAGFAWGAGAFLALPAGTDMLAAIVFATAPAIAVAVLLREREAVFLFLAPVAALTAFACVLKPFDGNALTAGLVLLSAGVIAAFTFLTDRRRGQALVAPSMLPLT